MSESEFVESLNLHASNAIDSFSIYISFTFAYLTAAYLVGAKLTRFQVFAVSALYLLAAGSFWLSTATHAESFNSLTAQYSEYVRSVGWRLPWHIMASAIQVGGIAVSLYFMFDIRHRARKQHGRTED